MKKTFTATWPRGVLTGAWLLTFTGAHAQQLDSLPNNPLREVTITATRAEKAVGDVGRSVTVLTAADLQQSVYRNVAEVLSQQAGIYVVGTGQNFGMTQSIFLRGANSNQTTILVDGIRVTDASGINNALDLSELSLAQVERLEIVRGSHSTLYGSAAIGGVVNIITKKENTAGWHPQAALETGTFGKGTGLFNQQAGVNFTHPTGFYLNAAAENQRIQGLDATVDTAAAGLKNIPARDQDDYRRLTLAGKLGFRNQQWDVFGAYRQTDQQTDFDKRAYTDDDNAVIDFTRHLFTYSAAYTFSPRVQVRYLGGYSRMFRATVDDSSAVDATGVTDHTSSSGANRGATATDELQLNFTGTNITAVAGLGRNQESMNARSYYYNKSTFGVYESRSDLDSLRLKATTTNVFGHLEVNGAWLAPALKALQLAVGARYNRHSRFGNYTTVEINPSYRVAANTLFYGVYATGFNAPSLYQLYTPNQNTTSGITRGNRQLQPETSASYEIGVKQTFGTTQLGLAYFSTDVKNTIEYVYLWTPNKPLGELTFTDYQGDLYLNLSRQLTRGVELDFKSELTPKVQLGGNLSLVNGSLKAKPTDVNTTETKGNQVQFYNNGAFVTKAVEIPGLVRRPNTANVNLTYQPGPKLGLRLDMRYTGARADIYYDAGRGPFGALGTAALADYTLLDVAARFHFTPQLTANLRVENVLDKEYQEINGFRSRGRGFYLSLRYSR